MSAPQNRRAWDHYDAWKTAGPEPEMDAAEARQDRREECAAEAKALASGTVYAGYRFINGKVVRDTIGARVHQEDFIP
jgi:hypothetical protein